MITKEQVQEIALLARLKLTPEELDSFQKDFSEILAYFDTLEKADVENIPPLTHPLSLQNALREDLPKNEEDAVRTRIMESVPEQEQGYVKVPGIFQ